MKVFISSRSFGKINSKPLEMLKNAEFDVVSNPYNKKLNENELIELVGNASGIIAGTEPITDKVLNHAKELKVISRYGVGLDNIDLGAAKKKGIKVYNTPNAPSEAVAELTLSLILNLMRHIPQSSNSVKSRSWNPHMGNSLFNKTLGVVGLGRIGKILIKLVQPFDLNILAYELYPDEDFVAANNIKLGSLEEVLSQSDIVSLHLPLRKDTRNIIGQKELSCMKDTAFLINTARGGIIDENALINALKQKVIAGAALDVFEEEPYTGEFIELENALLTPHIGTYTEETRMRMEIETVENLIKALKGVVN